MGAHLHDLAGSQEDPNRRKILLGVGFEPRSSEAPKPIVTVLTRCPKSDDLVKER